MYIRDTLLLFLVLVFSAIGFVESWVDFSLFTPVSVAPDARRKGKIENVLPEAFYNVEESFNSQYAVKHSISNAFFDRLIQCYLRLPNSAIYEVYPQYQVPLENIYFMEGTTPFRECGIYITPVTMEQEGAYEMFSYAESAQTGQTYLTRQKFNVKVFEVKVTTASTSTSSSTTTSTIATTSTPKTNATESKLLQTPTRSRSASKRKGFLDLIKYKQLSP